MMELAEGSVLQYPVERCPANFIHLVGSRVEVLTVNHAKFTGSIYSMDPISGTLFMMAENHQEERSIKLIIGNSIKCLKILKLSLKAKSLLEGSTGGQHPQIMDEWRQLKDKLKLWLQQSRVPVAENEQGWLLVLGEVTVCPPYRPENCSGTNEVVLWRVQNLLENFFHQK